MNHQLAIGENIVRLTHLDKPLWKAGNVTKVDYIRYLMSVSRYMLPFLHERLLTVVRYPHGAAGESFYQKNCPDYAPDYIETHHYEGIDYIVCNQLESLIWLGNQLAFEFHVPFQTIHSEKPSEIVFDLDPPSRKEFHLSVTAALMIKETCDRLQLTTFVKTSGNKGLQIYIPLPENQFSYDDTRRFTELVASYLVEQEPEHFTIERLKKNRGHKLYVDYIQHAKGKTIIAPYSVRGNNEALVATPLNWEEVTESLSPEQFPITVIEKRLTQKTCPFQSYLTAKKTQPFQAVIDGLNAKGL